MSNFKYVDLSSLNKFPAEIVILNRRLTISLEYRTALCLYENITPIIEQEIKNFQNKYNRCDNLEVLLDNYYNIVLDTAQKFTQILVEDLLNNDIRYVDNVVVSSNLLLEWTEQADRFKEINENFQKISHAYEMIIDDEQVRNQIRANRQANRFRVVGGGFGLAGAAQGIATAGAINATTGLVTGTFNLIGKGISAAVNASKKKKIYQSHRQGVIDAVRSLLDYLYEIYLVIINEKQGHNYSCYSKLYADKVQAYEIYKHQFMAQNINVQYKEKIICECISNDPTNLKYYLEALKLQVMHSNIIDVLQTSEVYCPQLKDERDTLYPHLVQGYLGLLHHQSLSADREKYIINLLDSAKQQDFTAQIKKFITQQWSNPQQQLFPVQYEKYVAWSELIRSIKADIFLQSFVNNAKDKQGMALLQHLIQVQEELDEYMVVELNDRLTAQILAVFNGTERDEQKLLQIKPLLLQLKCSSSLKQQLQKQESIAQKNIEDIKVSKLVQQLENQQGLTLIQSIFDLQEQGVETPLIRALCDEIQDRIIISVEDYAVTKDQIDEIYEILKKIQLSSALKQELQLLKQGLKDFHQSVDTLRQSDKSHSNQVVLTKEEEESKDFIRSALFLDELKFRQTGHYYQTPAMVNKNSELIYKADAYLSSNILDFWIRILIMGFMLSIIAAGFAQKAFQDDGIVTAVALLLTMSSYITLRLIQRKQNKKAEQQFGIEYLQQMKPIVDAANKLIEKDAMDHASRYMLRTRWQFFYPWLLYAVLLLPIPFGFIVSIILVCAMFGSYMKGKKAYQTLLDVLK